MPWISHRAKVTAIYLITHLMTPPEDVGEITVRAKYVRKKNTPIISGQDEVIYTFDEIEALKTSAKAGGYQEGVKAMQTAVIQRVTETWEMHDQDIDYLADQLLNHSKGLEFETLNPQEEEQS